MDLKTYTELFDDCGVSVSCVMQFLGFKHYINYYKLNNHKDWMKLDRAKKRIIKYVGCSEFYGELKGNADFALIFTLPPEEWFTIKYENSPVNEKSKSGDFIIGWTVDGKPLILNIFETRSILIAGSSGGGKSSLMNCIIDSLHRSTSNLILDFIDLKQVEFSFYNYFPETQYKVSTTKREAALLLEDVKEEIQKRYAEMKSKGLQKATAEDFPLHVIFIDEYATLDAAAGTRINSLVSYITAVGRACNVFMVIATQHPKNNVIDNTIRANCLSKIVLACANVAQSNTICGQKIGVELLGKGDGYAILDGVVKPIRFQAPLYDDETRKALYKIVP